MEFVSGDLFGHALFDVLPDLLIGIELGGVGRQEVKFKLAVGGGDEVIDDLGLVDGAAIDHQEYRRIAALHQRAQEAGEDIGVDAALVAHDVQLAQGADG